MQWGHCHLHEGQSQPIDHLCRPLSLRATRIHVQCRRFLVSVTVPCLVLRQGSLRTLCGQFTNIVAVDVDANVDVNFDVSANVGVSTDVEVNVDVGFGVSANAGDLAICITARRGHGHGAYSPP